MAAAVIAARQNKRRGTRPEVKSSRRQAAYDHQEKYSDSIQESKDAESLRQMMAFDADHSGGLDAAELKKMIHKFGQGVYLDSNGKQLDFMHSGGGKHYPSDPSEEEISWLISSFSKRHGTALVGSEILYAMVTI